MGLFAALSAGVSGLNAQSNTIGILSNNIANANTTGYKAVSANFQSLVVPSGGTSFSPGGVVGNNQQLVTQQGTVEGTGSFTDMAINGGGFFVVNSNASGTGTLLLTRAGDFTQDSQGNFVNSEGYYLQGVPLTGGSTSLNIPNLQTVKVSQNSTSSATATSTLAFAGNLNSSAAIFPGPGETVTLANDSTNSSNTASDIIVNSSLNGLVRGAAFTVTVQDSSGNNLKTDSFVYGGFSTSRDITSSAGSLTTSPTLTAEGDADTEYLAGSAFTSDGTTDNVTVTVTDPSQYSVGGTINIYNSTGVGNISAPHINGNRTITAISGNVVTFTAGAADTGGVAGTGTAATISNGDGSATLLDTENLLSSAFVSNGTNAHVQVTVNNPSQYVVGGTINISGSTGVGNIVAANINGSRTITAISGNVVTFTAGAVDTGGVAGTGTPATVTNRSYAFTGNMLNAESIGGDFLTNASASDFTVSALDFKVTTSAGLTSTFVYNNQANPAEGQFNSLSSLATAINDASNNGSLTAFVQGGRIYISATDASQGVTFSNGDATGSNGLSGINWVQELGLPSGSQPNVNAAAANGVYRFNTLNGLSDQVTAQDSTYLTASVPASTGVTSFTINAAEPTNQIMFADAAGNNALGTSSLLKELGFQGPNGGQLTQVTGNQYKTTLPLTYNAASSTTDLSGGHIPSKYIFTQDFTVYDSLGNSHNVAFLAARIGINTWAVELASVPPTAVQTLPGLASSDGQIASGILEFNEDGSYKTVQVSSNSNTNPSLDSANIPITWTNTGPNAIGAKANVITSINWGTSGKTPPDGLSQNANASSLTGTPNGSPVGQLSGVTVNEQGFIVATYSNGQTQELYQVPLANVNNPDGLEAVSGAAYQQTIDSGAITLNDTGNGGTGKIVAESLEQSNVNISTQLTDLIVAQQVYGANSDLLKTVDQLAQELDQVIQ